MSQEKVWEKEYQQPRLLTKHSEPQAAVLRFIRYLKKQAKMPLAGLKVLDLGSGTGRNANYFAKKGAIVTGIEISKTALKLAKERAGKMGVKVTYLKGDIGKKLPFDDNTFDLVLDVTTSNSLNNKERQTYLAQVHRVLKPNGYFFVRALCKEGDKNAKNLLKLSPAKEHDTYFIPEMGLRERVFSRYDFAKLYSDYFKIIRLSKETGYTHYQKQKYKRHFWIAYLKKVPE